ncbi:hypothetical protein GSY69_02255 [Brevibacterium sp. 5221]|uniref:Uncharacterized protein n=1 Tax=Brevibacterium rongguiense TaxID=2695267 RepID=A0A6N9H579_9MICO|nr:MULTISPECIES: hypothetical protein [Brevibacterium]MYM18832.1 hypothetical protein [Brevibacterium rongguiense]WAL39901.1 hypothetical protein BRM1_11710 [Brevibacterium sp. BRM-1]
MKDTVDVSVRRSPRYGVFIGAGIVAGFAVGMVLWLIPADTSSLTTQFSPAAIVGLLMALCAAVGGFAGAVVALIVDRVGLKRARRYTVGAEYEPVERPVASSSAADAESSSAAAGAPTTADALAAAETDAAAEPEPAAAAPSAAPETAAGGAGGSEAGPADGAVRGAGGPSDMEE